MDCGGLVVLSIAMPAIAGLLCLWLRCICWSWAVLWPCASCSFVFLFLGDLISRALCAMALQVDLQLLIVCCLGSHLSEFAVVP